MSTSQSAKLDFILRLTDKVTAPLAKVKTSFNDLAERSQQSITRIGVGLAGLVGAGVAITEALQPALEQNRALGEIKSLGVAQDALDALNRKSLAFSIAYGENATAFVASAYQVENAIKGLTGRQLATFTNASNVLAKATKSDAETMTAYVGTLYNLNKAQADAMGKGAWVEALAGQTALAVQLFRTSGAQIGEAFDAAGGLASNAGVSLAEQMAVLGTASSTMAAGDAGGAYRELFENVTNASEKLGMSFVDQNGKLLPMLSILDKLKGRFGDLSIEANSKALREAFGGNAARLLTTLIKDTDTLTNGMNQLGQVRGMKHAEQMAKAMVDPWQQFAAAVMALRVSFGQVLMPILAPLFERMSSIAGTLVRWIELFPNIARVIGFATLGVLALIAAMAGFAVLNGVIGLFGLLASPIALIVLGIAALVIAVGAAIYYWDELKAAYGNTAWFQALTAVMTPVVLMLRLMGTVLGLVWDGLTMLVSAGVAAINWLMQFEIVTTAAGAVWDGFIWALKNLSPFALLGKALKGLIEMLNKIPGISIDTSFAELPAPPDVPAIAAKPIGLAMPSAGAAIPPAIAPALEATSQVPAVPRAVAQPMALPSNILPFPVLQEQQAEAPALEQPVSLSPTGPSSVPKGGLLSSIQNVQNTQNRGTHVEKVEIHTGKAITPLELEQMMAMAVGG